jgi:NAD(P)H-dependent FMN reductase
MPSPHTLILIGSVRENRTALPVANWVHTHAAAHPALTTELVDLADWPLPFFPHARPPAAGSYTDPLQQKWADKIASADGYILVAPEYNHGPSAVLKNALDTVYAEWNRKPVAFVAYGGVGGARAVEQLRLTCIELQMAPLEGAVHITGAGAKRQGDVFTGDERDTQRLGHLFDELAWWVRALKTARDADQTLAM